MNWKIVLGVIIVVIAALVFLKTGKKGEEYSQPTQNQPSRNQIGAISAAGDVDASVDAILSNSASEQAFIEADNSDVMLYNSESSSISDIGQSYDSNAF